MASVELDALREAVGPVVMSQTAAFCGEHPAA